MVEDFCYLMGSFVTSNNSCDKGFQIMIGKANIMHLQKIDTSKKEQTRQLGSESEMARIVGYHGVLPCNNTRCNNLKLAKHFCYNDVRKYFYTTAQLTLEIILIIYPTSLFSRHLSVFKKRIRRVNLDTFMTILWKLIYACYIVQYFKCHFMLIHASFDFIVYMFVYNLTAMQA